MQLITPENLHCAFQQQLKYHSHDGLFIVSMDHCPSEQLTGEDWHTTSIILSSGVEHAELANKIALQLRPKTQNLMKWKKARPKYRERFLQVFHDELRHFPAVYALSISAKESTIINCLTQLIEQLKLKDRYKKVGSSTISFGTVIRVSDSKEIPVAMSENRASMCLFTSHFVLRMHQKMYEAANSACPEHPCQVNWNFFADKFPGPLGSEMDLLFQVLLSTYLDRNTGRILWGYFTKGGQVETDLLVDNLAGALNISIQLKKQIPQFSKHEGKTGLFYWEFWND